MKLRLLAAIPPSLALAACSSGGGGGAGPAITPPAPTPAPTPAATPAPTPTPAPAPTPSNASLTGTLISESFAADSARGAATFSDAGATGGTANSGDLQIRYDATSGSYTLTSGARSQTFGANARQVGTNAAYYTLTNGNTVDTLTLTLNGTSGAGAYQYVGAGVWLRAVTNGNSVDGSLDSFTYGVTTPIAALPRTGTATYAVDAIGLYSGPNVLEPNTLNGTGTLTADFASGRIDTAGTFNTMGYLKENAVRSVGRWSGSGAIAASTNSLSGSMTVRVLEPTTGGFSGRFYGPASDEIGLSFWGTSRIGEAIAGSLLGRRGDAAASPQKLTELNKDASFTGRTAAVVLYESNASGPIKDANGNLRLTTQSGVDAGLDYAAAADRYATKVQRLSIGGTSEVIFDQFSVGAAEKLAAQADPQFTAYRTKTAFGDPVDIKFYRPGGSNSELALSYLSFYWTDNTVPSAPGGVTTRRVAYVPFGYETPLSQIPLTGSATFNGVLYGTGVSSAGQGSLYTLSGTSSLQMNFASASGTLTLNPVGKDLATGASVNFGSFSLSIHEFDGKLSGFVSGGGGGTFAGRYFGPTAQEVGGAFNLRPELVGNGTTLTGVALAKR